MTDEEREAVAALMAALRKAEALMEHDGYCASHRGARGLAPEVCNCTVGKVGAQVNEALLVGARILARAGGWEVT